MQRKPQLKTLILTLRQTHLSRSKAHSPSLSDPHDSPFTPIPKSSQIFIPPYEKPSALPKSKPVPIKSGLPFDFRYSYSESDPSIKPIGFRESPRFSPFDPGRLDREWNGVSADFKGDVEKDRVLRSREEVLGDPLTEEEVEELVEKYRHVDCARQINLEPQHVHDKTYLSRKTFRARVLKIASYGQIGFINNSFRIGHCRYLHYEMSSSSSAKLDMKIIDFDSQEHICELSKNDSCTRDAIVIQEILKAHENDCNLESALTQCMLSVNEDLVIQVLQRHRSDRKAALSFFNWASTQKGYSHGSRAYNLMIDILGRMKQIKVMRQVFDEIPKESCVSIVNERTFSILMNRYAAAHKVQEAIDIFYKRKDYGFELDLVSFQTLLMSLCRFKHVEEAQALFLQKQNEFPLVIKSMNIILNGWSVLGSLREVKRFWNDIISSKCEPDLFTYSIFINSLTKAGKLGTAVKLLTSMREKGCKPDVPICNNIIDQLCFKKKIPEALEIFREMNGQDCLPDVATYNSLIKHLCKIRRMEKVYELLNEMERKNCSPNARTYSYILKTLKKPEDVGDLLWRMEKTGVKLNVDTYNLILNLYVGWKYQKGIEQVWAEMEKNGLGPDQRSYTIMVHGLHNQGKLDKALEFYSKMRFKGMVPEPRTRLLIKAIHLIKDEKQ